MLEPNDFKILSYENEMSKERRQDFAAADLKVRAIIKKLAKLSTTFEWGGSDFTSRSLQSLNKFITSTEKRLNLRI